MPDDLSDLNEAQMAAVTHTEGPLLVLAGAGSGKTRVLTRRIAYLVQDQGVSPSQILAMTFTNKAAGEMRERVQALLAEPLKGMWAGTFHSLCARILRTDGAAVGVKENFAIYAHAEQVSLVKRAISSLELDEEQYPAKQVHGRISKEKNALHTPQVMATLARGPYEREVSQVFERYDRELRRNNAVDFDDLLVLTVRLFQEHKDIAERYARRFRHILIDEYQDTNRPQYVITNTLAEQHRNLCVVGDDDQSIYGWRGADIRNILDFEKDYPDATIVRLEQNYRSTKTILDVANAVIENNRDRKGKNLRTDGETGEKVLMCCLEDESVEAEWICRKAADLQDDGVELSDMAVLYRTNAQSRAIEDELRSQRMPYVIVGGLKFYDRREIRDILAYLKLAANPHDWISLRRIINVPRRGIGDKTVTAIEAESVNGDRSPSDVMSDAECMGLGPRAVNAVSQFEEMMSELREHIEDPARLVREVISKSGYLDHLSKLPKDDAETRTGNVRELAAAVEGYCDNANNPTMEGYLREVALVADADREEGDAKGITLMTVHAAKGLEYPVVFVTGLEDGLFPILKEDDDTPASSKVGGDRIEEERRLFYVAITRARVRLFLSLAYTRRRFGGHQVTEPSRFLAELPKDLVEAEVYAVAAQLPPERPENVAHPGDLESDERVRHWKWGDGTIVASEGNGDGAKLTIRFDSGEEKRLMAKYADLEAI